MDGNVLNDAYYKSAEQHVTARTLVSHANRGGGGDNAAGAVGVGVVSPTTPSSGSPEQPEVVSARQVKQNIHNNNFFITCFSVI